ncbi:HAD-superfamily subfamily IB hydrolase, TIGR01490 [Streptomyces sp. yr375]|uniref:HAD family hydrolase n=1 Tax=Streptomyces sp. yr375 TaxID=1761906 RepID=UPI0008D85419|nr:HAD family hydrolase [Streptomyces sp. yr375]SEP92742.1 HAD-superfamily subfamily IB hydrolase, TIGR01490 [Streptomyces sp. yr375]
MTDTDRPYVVFSDVDETLITVKSMFDFLHYQLVRRQGTAGEEEYERIMAVIRARSADGTPRADINRFYYSHYTDESAETIAALADDWFAERSSSTRGFYIDSTREALRAHRAAGASVVLVSGSFPPLLEPLAREVGADAVLCTRPRIVAGRYTGEVDTPVIGEGKRAAVLRQLAARPDVDPRDCHAYGDHISDLPMLELVGHPVVVGDDSELREALAQLSTSVRTA